jgi:hypothetical protein
MALRLENVFKRTSRVVSSRCGNFFAFATYPTTETALRPVKTA